MISAFLICHGLRVSFLDGPRTYQTRSMIVGLMGFTVLLAVMAWLVIKLGKVWNDARTLLVLVLLMFVAISIACDYSLADSLTGFNHDGTVNFLAGFVFALLVSEGLLWGLGIRLPLLYRGPFYLFLALFFLYPVAISPLMERNGNRWLAWALFGFSPAAGLAVLALLPAVRRGPGYGAPNGTPWPWPWFPWTLFVVLAVAVGMRAYSMLLSFHAVAGPASIFRPYFLVPFLWAVGLLLLEIGLVSRKRGPQALALAVPAVLLGLAAFNGSTSLVHRQFVAEFERLLGGSPLFLSLLAVIAFYALAAFRRVPAAFDLLTLAIGGLSVVGVGTHGFHELTAPNVLPLWAAALAQAVPAFARYDSRRWLLAGGVALAAAALKFQDTWFTAYDGVVALHLFLLLVLIAGTWSRDTWARGWQNLAAIAMGTSAIVWSHVATQPTLAAETPPAALLAYPLAILIVAWAYGRLVGNRLYDAAAAVHAIAFAAVAVSYPVVRMRQMLPGFDYIAWGAACFTLAALISLLKTGLPQRWWARRAEARRTQI
ncbi:MAG TPA: hypothetical protein VGX76_06265 [Pirellulales bacterium]|nr:hypothetical protein [Pirellulales bacterium]